jgi:hypothetical protein
VRVRAEELGTTPVLGGRRACGNRTRPADNRLVFAESGIDALSYAALHGAGIERRAVEQQSLLL